MKSKLKYLIALLQAGSIGMLFMPLIRISIVELSVMDILKIGLGNYGTSGVGGEIYTYVQEYLKSDVIFLIGLLLVILTGAFVTVVVNGRKAYIIALVSSIINTLAAVFICVYIKGKINEVKEEVSLLDLEQVFKLSYSTIALWILWYAVIFILCILGIALWRRKAQQTDDRLIIPEDFQPGQNPWEPSDILEERDCFKQIHMLEEENKTETPKQGKKDFDTGGTRQSDMNFEGAVIGESGAFTGKVYPLKEREEVFFWWEEGMAVLEKSRKGQSMAGIYYVSEYQEYCVDVFAQGKIFLNSGQPLGKGRQYYLPRGTGIYIVNRENIFTLA